MEFRIRDGPGGFQYLKMPRSGSLAAAESELLPELCTRDEFAAQLARRLNRASVARLAMYATLAGGSFLLGSTFGSPAANLPLFVGLVVVFALGALVAYGLAGKLDHARRSTVLIYEWYAGSIVPYECARNACRAGSEARRVIGRTAGRAARGRVAIREMRLPHVWVNVEVWGIDSGPEKLYFLPDGVLAIGERVFRSVAYDQVSASGEITIETEPGTLPPDARIVGHHRPNAGRPDARLSRSAPLPRVAYASVTVRLDGLAPLELQFSNVDAGLRFRDLLDQARREAVAGWGGRRRFGTWWERPRFRARTRPTAGAAPAPRLRKSACDVLGVRPTATLAEITAAYRAMAQQYHPDLHANRPHEFRELAERRMKEINAAYEELKRQLGNASPVD